MNDGKEFTLRQRDPAVCLCGKEISTQTIGLIRAYVKECLQEKPPTKKAILDNEDVSFSAKHECGKRIAFIFGTADLINDNN